MSPARISLNGEKKKTFGPSSVTTGQTTKIFFRVRLPSTTNKPYSPTPPSLSACKRQGRTTFVATSPSTQNVCRIMTIHTYGVQHAQNCTYVHRTPKSYGESKSRKRFFVHTTRRRYIEQSPCHSPGLSSPRVAVCSTITQHSNTRAAGGQIDQTKTSSTALVQTPCPRHL